MNYSTRDAGHPAIRAFSSTAGFSLPHDRKARAPDRDAPVAATTVELPDLIGVSPVIQALYIQALGFADSGRPLLISGRAGSGKSALAHALHRVSQRSGEEFRVMRSVVFPDAPSGPHRGEQERGLSTLFGTTVATGTLVLDEIGDLSLAAQAALHRQLQRTSGPVNLIALTHMNLQQAVAAGRFRADLLACLGHHHLVLPNLTERQDDLYPLAERFRTGLAATNGGVSGFSECALTAMHDHSWPGNLRELRNRVERAMLIARSELVRAADLGLRMHSA